MKKILILSLLAITSLTACESDAEKRAKLEAQGRAVYGEVRVCSSKRMVGRLKDPAEIKQCEEYSQRLKEIKAQLDKLNGVQ